MIVEKGVNVYDVAVIGAGINGCSVAYFLAKSGKRVALFDKEGIAAGGSGAAGAFISPKFSKGGELKELMEKSYLFSLDFYSQNFPSYVNAFFLIQARCKIKIELN